MTNVQGSISSTTCVSGNTVDKIPAMICNEVSLVKVLVDATDEVDA